MMEEELYFFLKDENEDEEVNDFEGDHYNKKFGYIPTVTESSYFADDYGPAVEGYWHGSDFWPDFLADARFDHYYLVEVFKAVLSDPDCRRTILKAVIKVPFPYLYIDVVGVTMGEQLTSLKRALGVARDNKMKVIVTWKYPVLTLPGESEPLSHYITLFIDAPEQSTVLLDSRGVDFARKFHISWQRAYNIMRKIIEQDFHFHLFELNCFDMQLGDKEGQEDQFCQTWSLVLLEEFLLSLRSKNKDKDTNNNHNNINCTVQNNNTNNNDTNGSELEKVLNSSLHIVEDLHMSKKRRIDMSQSPILECNFQTIASEEATDSSSSIDSNGVDYTDITEDSNSVTSSTNISMSLSTILSRDELARKNSRFINNDSNNGNNSDTEPDQLLHSRNTGKKSGRFSAVVDMWRRCLAVGKVRELLYQHVYFQTHYGKHNATMSSFTYHSDYNSFKRSNDGIHNDNIFEYSPLHQSYFAALERRVCGPITKQYPADERYDRCQFTLFLEDFVDHLARDPQLLSKILFATDDGDHENDTV